MELIVTTPEQLYTVIQNAVFKALNIGSQPQQAHILDRCNIDDALQITGLSKSKLYKLTASKEIPFKTFGNRLVFSRKELLGWIESQTISQDISGKVSLQLAKSSRRKSLNLGSTTKRKG